MTTIQSHLMYAGFALNIMPSYIDLVELRHNETVVYSWKQIESMLASRRAKAQSAAMTPEARSERARHAVAARKWRAVKQKDSSGASESATEKSL